MKLFIKYSITNVLICLLLFGIVQTQCDLHRRINNEHKIAKNSERFYDKAGICSEAGYRRNETDASQFYRCVDYYGNGKKFVVFRFACPPALEFDEKLLVCTLSSEIPIPIVLPVSTLASDTSTVLTFISNVQNSFSTELPSSVDDPEADTLTLLPPFTSTSAVSGANTFTEPTSIEPTTVSLLPLTDSLQTFQTSSPNSQDKVIETVEKLVETSNIVKPIMEMDCSSEKFYQLPNSDCNRFYQCYLKSVSIFSCAPGLVFDENISRCSLPGESNCRQPVANPIAEELPTYFDIDCSWGVLRRYSFDCNNFYQCYDDGVTKSLLFYVCSAGLVFDEESNRCLLPNETSPCYANARPSELSPFDYHLQRLFQSLPNAFA